MSKLIVNVETGETVERELNKAEKDQEKVDLAKLNELKAEAETKAAEKQALLDRLGITADEAKLLLG
jgi:phosphoribosylformylglycinamidine (FGAM) synthase PurS component